MKDNHTHFGIGNAIGLLSSMLPDALSWTEKAIFAIVTAFCTGFVYRAGGELYAKLIARRKP